MVKTENNLKEAFAGELQAYQRYLAFAQGAADGGQEGVYQLFQAVAESEWIQARRHEDRGNTPPGCGGTRRP
jgi:rubrerythrin